MVTFDCSASHHDGVALVTVHLRRLDVPTRVTVRNCLDGPVWPPRSEGLPEAGWSETGFSGVLAPGAHALGYATPAQPEGQPAELADAVAVPEADPIGARSGGPADVVRELGDPSPPADAVPAVEPRESPVATAEASSAPGAEGDHPVRLPSAVEPWLAEMERRVDSAEALAAAETLPEATAAVRGAGGLAEVRALADDGDERRLRLVARRARRLADRRARATIPVETLSTLA
ncbi:DUF7857 domain-containing protein [Haloarcula laminariae]|uniref:DUF7857 domain-containing protein n=1 Tax=Haloarcula laminariae TaxID=2961577 RepID=UPI0024076678|nr:hypothetical protein [Halomicroarcula sp. FL173]